MVLEILKATKNNNNKSLNYLFLNQILKCYLIFYLIKAYQNLKSYVKILMFMRCNCCAA